MVRFSNYYLIPNPMLWILNMLLYTAIIQNKDAAIVVELDIEVENTKF